MYAESYFFIRRGGDALSASVPPSSRSIRTAVVLNLTDPPCGWWAAGLRANVSGGCRVGQHPVYRLSPPCEVFISAIMDGGRREVCSSARGCVFSRCRGDFRVSKAREMEFRSPRLADWGDACILRVHLTVHHKHLQTLARGWEFEEHVWRPLLFAGENKQSVTIPRPGTRGWGWYLLHGKLRNIYLSQRVFMDLLKGLWKGHALCCLNVDPCLWKLLLVLRVLLVQVSDGFIKSDFRLT